MKPQRLTGLSFRAKRSGVENGAVGKPRHRRGGRRLSEPGGERIKSLTVKHASVDNERCLDFARHDKKTTEVWQ
jgi:hypothetical protein